MKKTKIRRSLFIGLGGTGMRTLLHLKKMFIDTYGEVPPMIGFLGVDTDEGEYSNELPLRDQSTMGIFPEENTRVHVEGKARATKVNLEPIEQMQITVEQPRQIYNARTKSFSWLPKENLTALKSLKKGAGQVRTNGRFAITANSKEVQEKIQDRLNEVANVTIVDNPYYELLDADTDIYMIFSLGGGTGCGTFIDMAYLVRKISPNCKLAAYAVMPNVFRAKFLNEMGRVRPNAYGAILDLDWLMCMDWDSKGITLPLQDGKSWTCQESPFDACIFIDNENRNHDIYRDNAQLEEMIALSLVTAVGELAKSSTSVLDNLAVSATQGTFDIEHKRAWVSGMGICEAIIRTEELRKIYAHKAANYLINQMLNSPADVNNEVMAWIDRIQIREHEADQVIDFISDKTPYPMPEIDSADYKDPQSAVVSYLRSQEPDSEAMDAKLETLKSRVAEELRLYVNESLNRRQGMGVGATEEVLKTIENEVKVYLSEMQKEKNANSDDIPQYQAVVDSKAKSLEEESKSLITIHKQAALQDLAKAIKDNATNIAVLNWENSRRDRAITFYNDLLSRIQEHKSRVAEIRQRLQNVADSSKKEIALIHNGLNSNVETFQYNLTSRVEGQTALDEEHILMADLLDALGNVRVYDFGSMETSTICQYILQYTYNLTRAKELANMDINDIMNVMSEQEFAELVRKLVAKSSPLLLHNYRGYKNGKPAINYYIGVSDFEKSRLKKDDYFKKNIRDAADVNFSRIGMRDRLIIFSQMSPIPPFAIDSIDECKEEYEDPQQTVSFHFDSRIKEEMKNLRYTIFPGIVEDDALSYWVKGLLFGMIKNEGGKYSVQSKTKGSRLRHFWVNLCEDRDLAFKMFEESVDVYGPEIKEELETFQSDKGQTAYEAVFKEALDGDNYLERFSQVGLTIEELEQRQYETVFAMLEEEMKRLESF